MSTSPKTSNRNSSWHPLYMPVNAKYDCTTHNKTLLVNSRSPQKQHILRTWVAPCAIRFRYCRFHYIIKCNPTLAELTSTSLFSGFSASSSHTVPCRTLLDCSTAAIIYTCCPHGDRTPIYTQIQVGWLRGARHSHQNNYRVNDQTILDLKRCRLFEWLINIYPKDTDKHTHACLSIMTEIHVEYWYSKADFTFIHGL